MSSAPFDVQRQATEIEISEAIRCSDPDTADTIRRLAFERDRLKDMTLPTLCAKCRVRPVDDDRSVCETCYPKTMPQLPDGTVWAMEFMERFGKCKEMIEYEVMLQWFAQAIMSGYECGVRAGKLEAIHDRPS